MHGYDVTLYFIFFKMFAKIIMMFSYIFVFELWSHGNGNTIFVMMTSIMIIPIYLFLNMEIKIQYS